LSAVIAWYVLRRLGVGWAWLSAAVFALHPVNVEAVAWVSQCKSLLATVFGFGSLLCFCRYDAHSKRSWYAASLLLCAASYMSKSSMLMMPIVLAGYLLWQRGSLRRRDLFDLAPFFLLTVAFGLGGWWFMQNRGIKRNSHARGG